MILIQQRFATSRGDLRKQHTLPPLSSPSLLVSIPTAPREPPPLSTGSLADMTVSFPPATPSPRDSEEKYPEGDLLSDALFPSFQGYPEVDLALDACGRAMQSEAAVRMMGGEGSSMNLLGSSNTMNLLGSSNTINLSPSFSMINPLNAVASNPINPINAINSTNMTNPLNTIPSNADATTTKSFIPTDIPETNPFSFHTRYVVPPLDTHCLHDCVVTPRTPPREETLFAPDLLDISALSLTNDAIAGADGWCARWENAELLPLPPANVVSRQQRRRNMLAALEQEEVEFVRSLQVTDISQPPEPTTVTFGEVKPVPEDPENVVSFYQAGAKSEEVQFKTEKVTPWRLQRKRSKEGGYSLEESELKRLCCKFYTVNPPEDCVDDERFRRGEMRQPPFVLPSELEIVRRSEERTAESQGEGGEAVLAVGKSISELVEVGKAKIQSYFSTVLHSLYNDCDYYYPDVSNIPFLKYFSKNLKTYLYACLFEWLRSSCQPLSHAALHFSLFRRTKTICLRTRKNK